MSLYLSCLTLNPRHARTRSEFERPYELHRTLSKAWDNLRDARMLFRIEEDGGCGAAVLVQSLTAPDWSRLTAPDDYLLRVEGPKTVDLTHLAADQRCVFRLRCCPAKRVWCKGSENHGKRLVLSDKGDILAWLDRKAKASGFRIREAAFDRVRWHQTKDGQDVILPGVVFDGILLVTEPGLLRHALARGIGPGKAFGFGLLSIAPA